MARHAEGTRQSRITAAKKMNSVLLDEDLLLEEETEEEENSWSVERPSTLTVLFDLEHDSEGDREEGLPPVDLDDDDSGGGLISKTHDLSGSQLDPVKAYLQEMGSVSLLSSAAETEIAKKIEEGEGLIQDTILTTPLAVEYLREMAAKMLAGKKTMADILRGLDETDQQVEAEKKERFLWQISETHRLSEELSAFRLVSCHIFNVG